MKNQINGIKDIVLINQSFIENSSKKINLVFDQPTIAGNMGSKGKEIMRENFSWSNIAKKFALILNQNI